jgi:alkylhydroperoxidase family enzyme
MVVSMTWLGVESRSGRERDAVLGLQPAAGGRLLEALELSWSITDAAVLELCRLRMAQVLECRAELAAAERALLAELVEWRSSAAFSERERAALSYAEQFTVDQNGITDEQKEEIGRYLSRSQLVAFVQALNVHDGYLRLLTLLDVEPDPHPESGTGARNERCGPPELAPADEEAVLPAGGIELLDALTDPSFRAARSAFGASTARLSGVDDLTTECCRLRNAGYQACRY